MHDTRSGPLDPEPTWAEDVEWAEDDAWTGEEWSAEDESTDEMEGAPTRAIANRLLSLMSLFLLLVGVMVLLLPHQLAEDEGTGISAIQDALTGGAFLLAGTLLLWIRVLPVRRPLIVVAGLALAALSLIYQGVIGYALGARDYPPILTVVVVAILALAWLMWRYPWELPAWPFAWSWSLAATMAHIAAIVVGVMMIGFPHIFEEETYQHISSALATFGGGFIVLGVAGLVATVLGERIRRLQATINLLLAIAFVVAGWGFVREIGVYDAAIFAVLVLALLDPIALGLDPTRWNLPIAIGASSARRRVALSVTTVFFGAGLVITVVLLHQQENTLRVQAQAKLFEQARATEERIELYLEAQVSALGVMENALGNLPNLDPVAARPVLENIAGEYPGLINVSLVKDGLEVFRTDGRPFSDLASDLAVASANTNGPSFGKRTIDPFTGAAVIRIAQAIDDAQGQPLGSVVVATMAIDSLTANLLNLGEAGEESGAAEANGGNSQMVGPSELGAEIAQPTDLIVIDDAGNVVVVTDPEALAQIMSDPEGFVANHPAVRAAMAGREGALESAHDEDGTELYGFAPVKEFVRWAALVEQPTSIAFAGITAARDQAFFLLTLSSLLMAVISLFIARLVLKPAADLVEPVMAFGQGDYGAALPESDDSEIGALTLAFGEMRDEIQEREQQLADYAEELEDANRLKSEFLTTMSHELRTPMNGILGYGHLLLDGLDGDLTPQQAADVAQITESAEHLLQLINNVLDYSKIDAGWQGNPPEAVSLGPIIAQVRNSLALDAADKGIELLIDVPGGLPAAWVDPTSLTQILTNVVGNAVKFTERGQVTISARRPVSGGLQIAVADTGIGIAPEAMDHIFEAFRQADAGTSRQYGGTGLGLAIARRLAELQDGGITVTSQVGVGTTFTVHLPALEAPATEELPPVEDIVVASTRPVAALVGGLSIAPVAEPWPSAPAMPSYPSYAPPVQPPPTAAPGFQPAMPTPVPPMPSYPSYASPSQAPASATTAVQPPAPTPAPPMPSYPRHAPPVQPPAPAVPGFQPAMPIPTPAQFAPAATAPAAPIPPPVEPASRPEPAFAAPSPPEPVDARVHKPLVPEMVVAESIDSGTWVEEASADLVAAEPVAPTYAARPPLLAPPERPRAGSFARRLSTLSQTVDQGSGGHAEDRNRPGRGNGHDANGHGSE